jgi:hypothetical protein
MRKNDARQDETLHLIKTLVSEERYDFSGKVHTLMSEGDYEHRDLEVCIESARRFHKVESDELGEAIDGNKYVIFGRDTTGAPFYTAGKLLIGGDGKTVYFFITAHERDR